MTTSPYLSLLLVVTLAPTIVLSNGDVTHVGTAPKPTMRREYPVWVPDDDTRKKVAGIHTDQIAYLKFTGEDMIGPRQDVAVIVDDPVLIERFLFALRTAVELQEPIELPEPVDPNSTIQEDVNARYSTFDNACLEIFEKSAADRAVRAKPPLPRVRLDFEPGADFGPRFDNALRALQEYQASKIKAEVGRVAADVIAYRTVNSPSEWDKADVPRVTDPVRVKALVAALQQADGRVYECSPTRRKGSWDAKPYLLLELRDGREVNVITILFKPRPDGNKEDIWLRALWKLLVESPE